MSMDPKVLTILFDQLIGGKDIPVPSSMLKMSQRRATDVPTGMPYSINENLWHAVYWQELWLAEIRGEKVPPLMTVWAGDWKRPEDDEFGDLRERFLRGLIEARGMCDSFLDMAQKELLLRIAIHAAYHIGQINLLKRIRE